MNAQDCTLKKQYISVKNIKNKFYHEWYKCMQKRIGLRFLKKYKVLTDVDSAIVLFTPISPYFRGLSMIKMSEALFFLKNIIIFLQCFVL